MKVLQFKTNINCGNCVRAVTGFLNDVEGVRNWAVDTDNPDKILTVEGDEVTAEAVVEAVEDAGFDVFEVIQPA
jgi:copper chaperone CopZ